MKTVILINIATTDNQTTNPNDRWENQYPPFGLLSLEAFLKMHGYRVKVIDLLHISFSAKQLIENVYSFDQAPFAIGVSSCSEGIDIAYNVVTCLKKEFTNTRIIMGGYHASFLPETFFEIGGDFIVRFEGESTLIFLLEFIKYPKLIPMKNVLGVFYKKNNIIISTESRGLIKNLDYLPFSTNTLYTSPEYERLHIISSRGCPGECIFCASSAFSGRSLRKHSAEWIFSFIYYFKTHYMNKTVIDFIDDTFTTDKIRLKRILYLLKKSKLEFFWHARCRLLDLNKSFIEYLAENRCISLHFGVESGDQKILSTLKKTVKLDKFQNILGPMVRSGIRARCSFMIGHPQDTLETIEKTIYLASCLKEYGLSTVALGISTPYPGTVLFNDAEKLGLKILTKKWSNYTTTKPVYSTSRFDSDALRKAFYYFQNDRKKILSNRCFKEVQIKKYRHQIKTWIVRIANSL